MRHHFNTAVLPGLVVLLALVLRLWYVLALPGQGGDLKFSDMWTYDYTARQLVRGLPVTGEPGLNGYHPLSASTYYYVGYTAFVAGVYALFGADPAAVRVVQAIVGAATVGVVYLIGSLALGRRAALIAALLTAVYLPLVYYAGLLLSETWFIFLQMVSLALWLLVWRGQPVDANCGRPTGDPARLPLAVAAGFVAGLACLTRTAFVMGVAALAAGGLFVSPVPTTWKRRVIRATAFVLAAAAAIAPITIRNYQIHRRFILISTNGPSTFVTGHITHSSGLPPGGRRGETDVEMADRHRSMAIQYLALHWRDYLAEIPEFFEIIWTDNDFWPSTSTYWLQNPGQPRADIQAHMTGSPPFGRSSYFPDLVRHVDRLVWCLIGLPMGILAVLFLPRTHRRWSVLYLAILPYLVVPFIAYAFSRYRLPAVPLFFLLAGQTLTTCWECRYHGSGKGD
jgi:4-amino-4-deoxy-L-arabinose transferase-like glycosyltransferase